MRVFRRPYQQLALWLAVAAVLLRAMIPDGFMLERQAGERSLSLVFCYAGPLAALRGDDGAMAHMHHHAGMDMGAGQAQHDPAHHHHDSGQASCPFGAAAAPGLPIAALPAFDFSPAGPGSLSAAPGGALAAAARLRPPARAPPTLA